jgi:hypothetical protein
LPFLGVGVAREGVDNTRGRGPRFSGRQSEAESADRNGIDAIAPGDVANGLAIANPSDRLIALKAGHLRLATEPLTGSHCAGATLGGADPDQLTLPFGQAGEDDEKKTSLGTCRVEP